MLYAVVLAGGSGTRLWPQSRRGRPKQFLSLDGQSTLLQATVRRVAPLIAPERVLIATGADYVDLVRAQLPDLPASSLLVEPVGRGTAACIGLAALALQRRDPAAIMAVLSADHVIHDAAGLCAALRFAADLAAQGHLVTIGITPQTPSTAYGYIRQGAPIAAQEDWQAYQVAAFVEKPDAARAALYVAQGDYLWNAGIFVWQAATIWQQIQQHCPALGAGLQRIAADWDTPQAAASLARLFPELPALPIDIAVMERTARAVVIPAALGWSDVGDWAALGELLPRDAAGNGVLGRHLGLDTHNTLVVGDGRLIATIGVRDLVVIDTPDALLICPRDRTQEVRVLVAQLAVSPYHHVL
ncbi:mannose-1-phosphate guanylyltransferase [Kallotenue papyrolyticum]|uniref:mannose-1-phosphate guanylyltransferase n=1 Tax=Kallotenue papyrolyticum TaxID=1325125 RepID=UPI0004924390|nr:mannose-1-phosphate guanylyltransferase [Kallotenue papyrolyticum]